MSGTEAAADPAGSRVLHVYKTFFPDTMGGAEQAILEMCHGTLAAGGHAEVLTLSRSTRETRTIVHQGIRVTQVPTAVEFASSPFSLKAIRVFARMARDFDIIQTHYPWPFADLVYVLSGCRKPVVITYQSDIVKQKFLKYVYGPLMRIFFRRAKAVVVASPSYLRTSTPLVPYRDKALVIPLGLDEADYPTPQPARVAELRRQYGERFFSFVGVFRYYKGLQYLVQAAAGVPANIVLIGDGPEAPRLRAMLADGGIANVHFAGMVDNQEKVNILAASSAFVFPSQFRSEAYGLGLVEAAMQGLPMISCEIGTGTSFINADAVTGLVVPPCDAAALAAAMNRLLDDPALAGRFGEQARRRFGELFTARAMCEAYLALYRTIARGETPMPQHGLSFRPPATGPAHTKTKD
jgi:rhamnosyl/mannosyltransferase